jgi:hypothetical protein
MSTLYFALLFAVAAFAVPVWSQESAVNVNILQAEYDCAKAISAMRYSGDEKTPPAGGKPRFDKSLGLLLLPVDDFTFYFVTNKDIYFQSFPPGEMEKETSRGKIVTQAVNVGGTWTGGGEEKKFDTYNAKKRDYQFTIDGFGAFYVHTFNAQTQYRKKVVERGVHFYKHSDPRPICTEESPCEKIELAHKKTDATLKMLNDFLVTRLKELNEASRTGKGKASREWIFVGNGGNDIVRNCRNVKSPEVQAQIQGNHGLEVIYPGRPLRTSPGLDSGGL